MTPEPLVFSTWIDASPEKVFPFFTDPLRLTRWLGSKADVDPTAGGRFAVDIGHRLVRGEYVVVEPPDQVAFTWGDDGSDDLPPGASRVEVHLEASAGGTTVTLRHYDLPSEAQRADHARGWPVKLAELAQSRRGNT